QNYRDTYRERVEELVERKRMGEEIVSEPASKRDVPVVDLADALRRSVEAAKGRHRAAAAKTAQQGRSAGTARPTGSGRGAAASRGSPRLGAGVDLSELSKSDLYERATELDVPGRSKMSRQELEGAVRAASGSRRRRAS
ncbi:MAG: Ku protein, partial [Acidimicrobiales bacterium]